jgi:UDP-N-acetylglucosamine 2-epimerase (non-hydrolysing)/GDP/UDP-N,N'-diacetylbacillosamine 2-epimerase (hydrolysing)
MNFLVTCHAATLSAERPIKPVRALLGALDHFPEARVIFTKTNSDTEGRVINRMVDDYVKKNSDRAVVFTNMGQLKYLSAMKHVDVVIGNSSSGIIEAPAAKKPSVNIGSRQDGRMKAQSVIDCDETELSIRGAIEKALCNEFQKQRLSLTSLYGEGDASDRSRECLKTVNLNGILMKRFYET